MCAWICLSTNPHRTYDAVTDKTTIFLPFDNVGTGKTKQCGCLIFGAVIS